jgi:hypothetical protein
MCALSTHIHTQKTNQLIPTISITICQKVIKFVLHEKKIPAQPETKQKKLAVPKTQKKQMKEM